MRGTPRLLFAGVALVALALLIASLIVSGAEEHGTDESMDLRRDGDAEVDPTLAGRSGAAYTAVEVEEAPAVAEPAPWVLRGHVFEAESRAVPNARVTVRLEPGGGAQTVGSASSAADGSFEIPLAPLLKLSGAIRATSRLTVQAEKAGFQPGEPVRVEPLPYDVTTVEALDCRLELERGGVVTGRVTDGAGGVVTDADVSLVDASGRTLGGAGVDADGRFALGLKQAGTYRVWGSSSVHGLGTSAPLDCEADGAKEMGDLVLRAVQTIEGRVTYADGTPISGVQMYANRVQDDEDTLAAVDVYAVPFQVRAKTGEDGRFRMLTFRPGAYGIVLSDAYGGVRKVNARSGDHDVEIVLPLHKLTVWLLDARGQPVPGVDRSVHGWLPKSLETFERVLRGEVSSDEIWTGSDVSSAGSSSFSDGREVLLVPHGSGWVLSFHVEGLPPVERAVRVPSEGNESEIVLRVGAERPTGWLEIEVTDELGETVAPFLYDIRSVFGGRLVEGTAGPGETEPIEVPAGRVKLEVWTGALTGWLEKNCRAHSPYFRMQADADVPAGGTAKVSLRARRGGWIELLLEFPLDSRLDGLKRATVEVRRAETNAPWKRCSMFLYRGPPLSGRSWLDADGGLGVDVRLGRLYEAGPSELRVTAPGFKAGIAPVDVQAGKAARVRLVLQPE